MEKAKKSGGHFGRGLLIFALALLVLIGLALGGLWFFLADYQSALPANYGNQILQAFRTGDTAVLLNCPNNLPASLQTPDALARYLQAIPDAADLYNYQSSAENDSEITYMIRGKTKLAQLTLKPTGEKSRFGFALYTPENLEFLPQKTYTIEVQGGATPLADGQPLPTSAITGTTSLTDCFTGIADCNAALDHYEISDFTYIDTLTAQGPDGAPCQVDWNADTGVGKITVMPEDTVQQSLTQFAEQAAKAYVVFATARNAPRAPVLAMLYPGTDTYRGVQDYQNNWGEIYVSDRFENLKVDQFLRYGAAAYSCHVSLNYTITENTGKEKTYDFSYQFYITGKPGGWQLVKMENA